MPSLLVKAGAFLYTKFCVQVGLSPVIAVFRGFAQITAPQGR